MLVVTNRKFHYLLPALVVMGLSGCGGPYDASVEGMVTLDGSPVPSGAVAFIPTGGGPPGYALSDQSGRYEVFTGREAGLPSGEYSVTVVAREEPKEKRTKDGGPPPPGKRLTPAWYGSSTASPLRFTVEPGSNDIQIDLTSEPPHGQQPQRRRS